MNSNIDPTILICNHFQTFHLCLILVVDFHEWNPTEIPIGPEHPLILTHGYPGTHESNRAGATIKWTPTLESYLELRVPGYPHCNKVSPVQVWCCLSKYQIHQLVKYLDIETKDMILCWHINRKNNGHPCKQELVSWLSQVGHWEFPFKLNLTEKFFLIG